MINSSNSSENNKCYDHSIRLRILNPPLPIQVDIDQTGLPMYYYSKNKKRLKISVIQERWRIDDEWWREQISRKYFTAILENGLIITVFQDLLSQKWYSQ
ncbi:MAG TPA: hypothetical protein EYQ69_04570 [Gemmatimonadetes bacterium]|nr:hypothetical protein [Gemmatimonadota bacterium]